MSVLVRMSLSGDVAVLEIGADPSPANLTLSLRQALARALDIVFTREDVAGVVLIGGPGGFPLGADIAEIPNMTAAPTVADLCTRIEESARPVVAALSGSVLGGGLELALAAHGRVAPRDAKIGMPELRVGLMPSAGATQRLPRRLGAGPTLDCLLETKLMSVADAPAARLFDRLVDGDLRAVAVETCRSLLGRSPLPRLSQDRGGFSDMATYQAAIAERRERIGGATSAAQTEIIAAVEAAALLPFEAGLAFEVDSFETLLRSEASKALRHALVAERQAARPRVPEGTALPEIARVAILGGGPLAADLVVACLVSGLSVAWGARDPERLRAGVAEVERLFRHLAAVGRGTTEHFAELVANLSLGDAEAMAQNVDFAVIAAPGQRGVRLPLDLVHAKAVPSDVRRLGLRFQPPAYDSRLLEILAGPEAEPRDIAHALSFATKLNKAPVQLRSTGETGVRRLDAALQRAADALVDAGQSPYAIDWALLNWGWARLPFRNRDVAGLAAHAQAPRTEGAVNWSARLAEAGRAGRATGQGFYRHAAGGESEDPELIALLDAARPPTTRMPDTEIQDLLLAALADEGLHMVGEGMAGRPVDIDVIAILGLAFPRWRGGPMFAADAAGLFRLKRKLDSFDHPDRAFATPHPLWAELVKNGAGFVSLDAVSPAPLG
ncbi:enoyl-CoA hydratase-related protein [Litorisediminicola beolgyonensis]|uniref:Enoyl-CoA hydratase-related protein n=1 Tax=Litorisediminicola beolgyonensis TaxID=1173614 RepID=A0ABW3ZJS8_9RHOB